MAFGSSASCTTISDTSTWSRKRCSPSTTRSARGCHPCLRYVLLPMSPGWTSTVLAEGVGFEPTREHEPPGGFQDRCLKPLGHPSRKSQRLAETGACQKPAGQAATGDPNLVP